MTRATLWRHTVASMSGEDVVSHRFPLFRCQTAHTSVCGERSWRAVADPRHSVSWLCGQDPSIRAIVADRRGCGFILRVHAQTENVRCIAKWRGSTHSHGRLCGEALPIHTGDSVARLIQDTDALNKLQCGATASHVSRIALTWASFVYFIQP